MRTLSVVSLITLLLTACTMTEAPVVTMSTVSVSGEFLVGVDFGTLIATPIGHVCLLEAFLEVTFEGTVVGVAEAQIRVLVLAPCTEFFANPPGTFRDVFWADLTFVGEVAGEEGTADLTYRGLTKPGGAVKGLFRVDGETGELANVRGVLHAEGQAGVGGSYIGHLSGAR